MAHRFHTRGTVWVNCFHTRGTKGNILLKKISIRISCETFQPADAGISIEVMSGDFREKFLDWAKNECSAQHVRGIRRVGLLPYWPSISALLEDGFSMRRVWQFLQKKEGLECSYKTFLNFCRDQQGTSQRLPEKVARPKQGNSQDGPRPLPEPKKRPSPSVSVPPAEPARKFTFNSLPDPSLEESIEE